MKPLSIFLSRGKQNPSGQGDTNSVLGGIFRDYLRENRDLTKLRRRWQRPERQKSNRFNEHHAFCTFDCLPCITRTWPDQILSLLGNGNGRVINSTISVTTRERSLLFSSNPVSLLLSNWDPWINREKKWKDAKSIFQRRFHGRRRCRIVRSCTNVCGAATSIAESESRRVF